MFCNVLTVLVFYNEKQFVLVFVQAFANALKIIIILSHALRQSKLVMFNNGTWACNIVVNESVRNVLTMFIHCLNWYFMLKNTLLWCSCMHL